MLHLNKFRKDEQAIELPINIVVMLVVGMVALAALLATITNQGGIIYLFNDKS